eukprot:522879_1
MTQLQQRYDSINSDEFYKILTVNGKEKLSNTENINLKNLCMQDFERKALRFSSHPFYYSLCTVINQALQKIQKSSFFTPYNALDCLENAIKSYQEQICPMLSINSTIKINDNIFVYWTYLWTLSIICRKYMEPYAKYFPLQIDLVVIPNDTIGIKENTITNVIGSIANRLSMHNISFNTNNEKMLLDPSDIESVILNIEKCINVFVKTLSQKRSQSRIIVLIDRRPTKQDDLYCFTPPEIYSGINTEHEAINSIYNTCAFILPPLNTNTPINVKNSNLFVVSYLIRSKIPFINLYYDADEKNAFDGNCIINHFLFYNGGYCRCKAMDFKIIMPKLFTDVPSELFRHFDLIHSNLWSTNDDIWTAWNINQNYQMHLQCADFKPFTIKKCVAIDNKTKMKIKTCNSMWQKKHSRTHNTHSNFSHQIQCYNYLIDDDITLDQISDDEKMIKSNQNSNCNNIITNRLSEYFVPDSSKIQIESSDKFSTIYDVAIYCAAEFAINNEQSVMARHITDEKQPISFIETKPKVLIKDDIMGYHFFTVALSHIIHTFDRYKPFQISMGIIANEISTFGNIDKSCINIGSLLLLNQISYTTHTLIEKSMNGMISHIYGCIGQYIRDNCNTKLNNKRLIVLFEKIKINVENQNIQCCLYVYKTPQKTIMSDCSIVSNTKKLNEALLIPSIENNHPKLFILNTYYIHSTLIKCHFKRNDTVLRFFPEHMCTLWPKYFCLSTTDALKLVKEHKYRHQFGLPLPDSEFCLLYYAATKRRFWSTYYYRSAITATKSYKHEIELLNSDYVNRTKHSGSSLNMPITNSNNDSNNDFSKGSKQICDVELFHQLQKLYANNDHEQSTINTFRNDMDTNHIYVADHIDQWLGVTDSPTYPCMELELQAALRETEFQTLIADCDKYYTSKNNTEKLSRSEILSIKAFSDMDNLQKTFSKCYFTNDENRKAFYWWGITLLQSVRYLSVRNQRTIWRGLDKLYQLPSICLTIKQPSSFTEMKHVADDFAGESGMSIESCKSQAMGTNIKLLSDFATECEFLCYENRIKFRKIHISFSYKHPKTINFLRQYLRHNLQFLSEQIPSIDFFSFRNRDKNVVKEFVSDLLMLNKDLFQITKFVGLTLVQRLFFELKQYYIVAPIFNDDVDNITQCTKAQTMYLIENCLNWNIEKIYPYKRFILNYFEKEGINGETLRIKYFTPDGRIEFSKQLVKFINEHSKENYEINMEKQKFRVIIEEAIQETNYEMKQQRTSIHEDTVFNYLQERNLTPHKLYMMKTKEFKMQLKQFAKKAGQNITMKPLKILWGKIRQKLSQNILLELHDQIKNCIDNLAQNIPKSSETLLQYQLNLANRIDVFQKITGGMELLFDENTYCLTLRPMGNDTWMKLFSPHTFQVHFIDTEYTFATKISSFVVDLTPMTDKPALLKYKITLIYFSDKEYKLISEIKQLHVTHFMIKSMRSKTKSAQMIKLIKFHTKISSNSIDKETNLFEKTTSKFGGDEGKDEDWIYIRTENKTLTGIKLWGHLNGISGICLQINKIWQKKVYGSMNGKPQQLECQQGECITKVKLSYGKSIDSLYFYTNKGNHVGSGYSKEKSTVILSEGAELIGMRIWSGSLKAIQLKWLDDKLNDKPVFQTADYHSSQQTQDPTDMNMTQKPRHEPITNVSEKRQRVKQQVNFQQKNEYIILNRIDKELHRYYESVGDTSYYNNDDNPKLGKFSVWFQDNGLEIEDIQDELDVSADESILTTFDETFPLVSKSVENRDEQIFAIIKCCCNAGLYSANAVSVETSAPCIELSIEHYNLKEKQLVIERHFGILKKSAKYNDALIILLHAGEHNKYPLLQFFVDAYLRDQTLNKHNPEFCVEKWGKDKLKSYTNEEIEIITDAIRCFFRAIIPKIQFNPLSKIDDNLQEICQYIALFSRFIQLKLQDGYWTSALQIDLIFAVNEAINDDRETHSIEYSESKNNMDYIDMLQSLKSCNSVFVYAPIDINNTDANDILNSTYEEYEYQLSKGNHVNKNRFCIFIDRRNKYSYNLSDELIIFNPKINNGVQLNCLPEQYLKSLFTCLIPTNGDIKNISVTDECNDRLLTFSFEIRSLNEVRCRLFWNARMTRFYPKDVLNTLPNLFTNGIAECNLKYISGLGAKNIMCQLQFMNDMVFESFYNLLDTDRKIFNCKTVYGNNVLLEKRSVSNSGMHESHDARHDLDTVTSLGCRLKLIAERIRGGASGNPTDEIKSEECELADSLKDLKEIARVEVYDENSYIISTINDICK